MELRLRMVSTDMMIVAAIRPIHGHANLIGPCLYILIWFRGLQNLLSSSLIGTHVGALKWFRLADIGRSQARLSYWRFFGSDSMEAAVPVGAFVGSLTNTLPSVD